MTDTMFTVQPQAHVVMKRVNAVFPPNLNQATDMRSQFEWNVSVHISSISCSAKSHTKEMHVNWRKTISNFPAH